MECYNSVQKKVMLLDQFEGQLSRCAFKGFTQVVSGEFFFVWWRYLIDYALLYEHLSGFLQCHFEDLWQGFISALFSRVWVLIWTHFGAFFEGRVVRKEGRGAVSRSLHSSQQGLGHGIRGELTIVLDSGSLWSVWSRQIWSAVSERRSHLRKRSLVLNFYSILWLDESQRFHRWVRDRSISRNLSWQSRCAAFLREILRWQRLVLASDLHLLRS